MLILLNYKGQILASHLQIGKSKKVNIMGHELLLGTKLLFIKGYQMLLIQVLKVLNFELNNEGYQLIKGYQMLLN